MKTIIKFCVGILLVVVLVSCELFLEKPPEPKLHAVYIALDYHYTRTVLSDGITYTTPYISGPIQDIKEVAVAIEQLKGEHYFSQGGSSILMVEEEGYTEAPQLSPTKENIQNQLQTYHEGNSNEVAEHDIFLLYYTGHGGATNMPIIVADDEPTKGSVITKKDITDWITPFKGKKVVIIDSCYSGQVIDDYPREPEDRDTSAFSPDTFFLSASQASQTAKEATFVDIGHRHGFFTYYFLKAIGWDHAPEEEQSVTIGTGEFARSITVPGTLREKHTIPTYRNETIQLGDVYRYISDYFRFVEHWIVFQTPQTTLGPIDLVLFQEKW